MKVSVRHLQPPSPAEDQSQPLLAVDVTLSASLAWFVESESGTAVKARDILHSYLTGLAADLGLPSQVALHIHVAGDDHPLPPDQAYGLTINQQPGRLPLPVVTPPEIVSQQDGWALAQVLATAVHLNRELCLSDELAAFIQQAWLENGQPEATRLLEADVFCHFLQALVWRGFSVMRGQPVFADYVTGKRPSWQTQVAFEDAVDDLAALSLDLHLSPFYYNQIPADAAAPDGETAVSGKETLPEMAQMLQDGIFYELGVYLPKVRFLCDEQLDEATFRLQVNDVRLPAQRGLPLDAILVNETPEQLEQQGIMGQQMLNPANGNVCTVIKPQAETRDWLENEDITTWNPFGYMILATSAVVRAHAGAWMNLAICRHQMDRLEWAFPALVEAARKRIGIRPLTHVLRCLSDEELSTRDLRTILEGLLLLDVPTAVSPALSPDPPWWRRWLNRLRGSGESEAAPAEPQPTPALYLTEARIALRRYLCHKYTRGQNVLPVLLLEPALEALLEGSLERPLTPNQIEQLHQAILPYIQVSPPSLNKEVILTRLEIRRHLAKLVRKEFPQIAVLAYQELSPDMNIQPRDRIVRPSTTIT